jgi:hypothetical protein
VWNPKKMRKDGSGMKGDWDKPLFNAHTGRLASSTDPRTWAPFDDAFAAYRNGGWDGIGFVLTLEDGLTGFDLDHCRDKDTGAIVETKARRVVDDMKTYFEVSPSGTGLRGFAFGRKPDRERSKNGWIEIYDGLTKEGKQGGRYVTITGHHLPGTPERVCKRQGALTEVYERELKPAKSAAEETVTASANGKPPAPDDAEIIRQAKRAKNGSTFKRLWAGDTHGYPSSSEADLALCRLLAFWTGPDADRIDRLFRQSGLMRDKWERNDYRQATIARALEGRTEFYSPRAPDGDCPQIMVTTEEHEVNEKAAAALGREAGIFQRGGLLVRVVRDDSPATKGIRRPFTPRIDPLPPPLLRERLAANARWLMVQEARGGTSVVPCHPPGWCVSAVHARGSWHGVAHLEAVVDYPVLRPDGTLLLKPGYDPDTALLLLPRGDTAEAPDNPAREDAIAARDALLEVVADFPFERKAHKGAWLAALLTPLARFAFSGPAPLFLVDANIRAAGKGLLLDCISRIVTGERFTVATYTQNEEELRKRITSLALGGDRLVLFDNLTGQFGNAVLDAALTATSWKDRLLGFNRMAEAPLYMTWYATGNNVAVGTDTARRVCHIRLESPQERPEERDDFRHPNLLAWVWENRPRLLLAALTILRAYCLAGLPDMGLSAWGSFDGWSRLVRSAVVWVGLPDPGKTRLMLQERADVEAESLAALLTCWGDMDTHHLGLTAAEVIHRLYKAESPNESALVMEANHAMREAVEALIGRPDGRALGNVLRSCRRRIFAGRFIDKVGAKGGVAKWAVYPAEAFTTRRKKTTGGKKTPLTPKTPCGSSGGRGFRGFRGSFCPSDKSGESNGEVLHDFPPLDDGTTPRLPPAGPQARRAGSEPGRVRRNRQDDGPGGPGRRAARLGAVRVHGPCRARDEGQRREEGAHHSQRDLHPFSRRRPTEVRPPRQGGAGPLERVLGGRSVHGRPGPVHRPAVLRAARHLRRRSWAAAARGLRREPDEGTRLPPGDRPPQRGRDRLLRRAPARGPRPARLPDRRRRTARVAAAGRR